MCGRLNIHDSAAVQALLTRIGLPLYPIRAPRFNIAPHSTVDVVLSPSEIAPMEWSIEFGKFRHPNSKLETIRRKPYLERLLGTHRCLVPVNRFYEWPDPKVRPKYHGVKTRFCIHTPDDVMLLGGLYRISTHGVMQFNIITTDPNQEIGDFHHRMPVIVPPDHCHAWLRTQDINELYAIAQPYQGPLTIYNCDAYVDNARNQGPRCMDPESTSP